MQQQDQSQPEEQFDYELRICKTKFFYNTTQRHRYAVYDFRPVISQQRLKNTLKINTIDHINDVINIRTHDEIKQYSLEPEAQSEKQQKKLILERPKRNYCFLLPFEGPDAFSVLLSDFVDERSTEKDDYVSLKAIDLYNFIRRQMDLDGSGFSPDLTSWKHITLDSPPILKQSSQSSNDFAPKSVGFLKHAYASTPNIQSYNVLEQPIENVKIFETTMKFYELLKKERFQQVYIILQPARLLFDAYPMLDYSIPRNRKFLDKTLPNEIIDGKLFLGNADHAMNKDLLFDTLKITHIVNAAREVQNGFMGLPNIQYYNVKLIDEVTEDIYSHFDKVYDYIDGVLGDENNKIFIHCAQGRSRSAALVMMYLMRRNNWSLVQAQQYVQDRREQVSVNDGFIQQLEKYETEIK